MQDKLDQINSRNIKEVCEFIIDNRNSLNIYFLIGSGFLKYVNKDKYKSWNDMFKQKFNYNLNTNSFMDYITIDIDYEKQIKETNEQNKNSNLINNKNDKMSEFWKKINRLKNSISNITKKNKINIITTNHCNTIETYFSINECVYIDEAEKFENKDLAILKLHNFNKDSKIYEIDGYYNFFKKNYLQRLFKIFENISKSGSNLIFIFGSSYSEIHINVLLRTITQNIENSNSKIVWLRNIDDVIEPNKNEFIENIEKMINEYNNKSNHIILFSKLDNMNELWNEINMKLDDLILRKLTFKEFYIYKNNIEKNEWFYLYNDIVSDFKNKLLNLNEKEILDEKLKIKDEAYISIILIFFLPENKNVLNWYLNNILYFNNTTIDINWFLSNAYTKRNLLDDDEIVKKVINKMCELKNQLDISTNHIVLWIEKAKINSKNFKWIIETIWNKYLSYEINNDFTNKYLSKLNLQEHKNFKTCNFKYQNYIVSLIKSKIISNNISITNLIFILFRMEKTLRLKIEIINLIKSSTKLNIVEIIKKTRILLLSNIYPFSQKELISIEILDNYLNENKQDINEIANYLNNNFKNKNQYEVICLNKIFFKYKKFKFLIKKINKNLLYTQDEINDLDEKYQIESLDKLTINNKFEQFKNRIFKFIEDKQFENFLNENEINFSENIIFDSDFFNFIWNSFVNFCVYITKKEINDEQFLKFVDRLNYYMKNYKNSEINYYYSPNQKCKTFKIDETIKIIKILDNPKYIWFVRSFISQYTFNGRLNPTSDFVPIFTNNFSLIELLLNIYKEKRTLEVINWNNKNKEYIIIYEKLLSNKIDNLINEDYFILKYILESYILKNKNIFRKNKYIKTLVNKNGFPFLSKLHKDLGTEFIHKIYFVYINEILYCNDAKKILEIFLGKDSIEIYKHDQYIRLMVDYIHHVFNGIKLMKNKKDAAKFLQNFINSSIENRLLFVSDYDKIEKTYEQYKNIDKYLEQDSKLCLENKDDIDLFMDEINKNLSFLRSTLRSDENIKITIYNLFLFMIFIYKIDKFTNIGSQKWEEAYNVLKNISLKDDLEDILSKINSFLEKIIEKK